MLGKAFSDPVGSTITLTSFTFCDFDRFKIAIVKLFERQLTRPMV